MMALKATSEAAIGLFVVLATLTSMCLFLGALVAPKETIGALMEVTHFIPPKP